MSNYNLDCGTYTDGFEIIAIKRRTPQYIYFNWINKEKQLFSKNIFRKVLYDEDYNWLYVKLYENNVFVIKELD